MREAQCRCDAREFAEWMAFYRLEPWGEQRGDLRIGILAAVVANMFRKKGRRALQPVDFMPKFEKKWLPMTTGEMYDKFKGIATRYGRVIGAGS